MLWAIIQRVDVRPVKRRLKRVMDMEIRPTVM